MPVPHPHSRFRRGIDEILHMWPLLVFIGSIIVLVTATLGNVYVSGIAKTVYVEQKMADPVINAIQIDLTAIKGDVSALTGNDVEIRTQLNTIETRLDTLIRIQMERRPDGTRG